MAAESADAWRAADVTFRTAFQQSPVAMSLQGQDGRFLMVNPAFGKMLRRSDAELREMTFADVCHPEAVSKDLAAMDRVLSGESQSLQTETRLVRSDGQVVWVLLNVSLFAGLKEGDLIYFFVQVQDITRARRSERRTRSLAELRRKALAGTTVEVLMEEALAAVESALDMDCEGVVLSDLAHDPRLAPQSELVEQGLVVGASGQINVRGQAHGLLSVYSCGTSRFSAADAEFVQAVADVLGRAIERRDHHEAQERLHQQERLAAVGQLAAGVAHDFNNIISAISLYAELLGGHRELDETGRAHLNAMRQQVERATALVWQVLDFANRSPIEMVDVDLSPFLAELMPILRSTLPEDVEIRVMDRGGPYVVRCDPTRLQQMFLNLATNARDAVEGPGTLTITLSFDRPPPEEDALEASTDGGWVRVDVTDTGCGMPPELVSRVFEPFFTTKPAAGGTGLGMAQVHSLVSQHGGHVAIESAPQRGTTVSLWLRGAGPGRASSAGQVAPNLGSGMTQPRAPLM